jgi:hypothetical protein
MKLQSKSSGQIIVILVILVGLAVVGWWWLNSNKQEMAKDGRAFAEEAMQHIIVQHDINFFGSHLSPQARMNFPVSAQQEFMNEIIQMGAPVGAVNLQGQIEFQSQFFEPQGNFHARINYPVKYADFDLTISHPVGRWQIDTIAFVKQAEQPGLAPAPAPPAAPPPAATAVPGSTAAPASTVAPAPGG